MAGQWQPEQNLTQFVAADEWVPSDIFGIHEATGTWLFRLAFKLLHCQLSMSSIVLSGQYNPLNCEARRILQRVNDIMFRSK